MEAKHQTRDNPRCKVLKDLHADGLISIDEAYMKATDKSEFLEIMKNLEE